MTEKSYFFDGLLTGDASLAPYDADDFSLIETVKYLADPNFQGVIGGYGNSLNVATSGGANATIDTGAAIVNGKIYINNAAITVGVSGATVYWLVGLQLDPALQTVRAFIRGSYASRVLALAALVHIAGSIWEIPLATILTTAGGNVGTIYDERYWTIRPPIETVFVAAASGRNITDSTDIIRNDIRGVPLADGKVCTVFGQGTLPSNFRAASGLYNVYAIFIPGASGNAYMSMAGYSAPIGSSYNTSSFTVALAAIAVTNNAVMNNLAQFSVSGALPGDVFSLQSTRDALNVLDTVGATVYFAGWWVQYLTQY